MTSKNTVAGIFPISIAFCACLAIYFDYNSSAIGFAILKSATTILIISMVVYSTSQPRGRFLKLNSSALAFCLIGDVLLLNPSNFVLGLLAFLIAHIIFTLSFTSLKGFKTRLIPAAILSTVGLAYYLFLFTALDALAVPVLLYILVILVMAWQGISLYLVKKESQFILIAVGCVLFLISDAVLALNKFKMPFEVSGVIILSTYWMAIYLLARAAVDLSKVSKELK